MLYEKPVADCRVVCAAKSVLCQKQVAGLHLAWGQAEQCDSLPLAPHAWAGRAMHECVGGSTGAPAISSDLALHVPYRETLLCPLSRQQPMQAADDARTQQLSAVTLIGQIAFALQEAGTAQRGGCTAALLLQNEGSGEVKSSRQQTSTSTGCAHNSSTS